MQQAFVIDASSCSLCERPVPTPKENEALVRVLIAGVCNTDLEIMKGYMGFNGTVGHEFVGVVEKAPPGSEALVGRRVVGDINLVCGQPSSCATCAKGGDRARNHCPNRTVLGILGKYGTYASYLTLPVKLLHVVPDCVSTENAAFAEPLAAACRIVEQVCINALPPFVFQRTSQHSQPSCLRRAVFIPSTQIWSSNSLPRPPVAIIGDLEEMLAKSKGGY